MKATQPFQPRMSTLLMMCLRRGICLTVCLFYLTMVNSYFLTRLVGLDQEGGSELKPTRLVGLDQEGGSELKPTGGHGHLLIYSNGKTSSTFAVSEFIVNLDEIEPNKAQGSGHVNETGLRRKCKFRILPSYAAQN